MSLFRSVKAVSVSTALLLVCAVLRAESPDDLIKQGDVFDRQFKPAQALELYQQAEKLEPQNVRILVRIARQYRHLMQDATARDEKLRFGNTALDYAQRAAALAPNDSEAQLSPAISYAKMLPLKSRKEQLEASTRIKEAAEKAIKLDPRNDLAWDILGRWHKTVANVGAVKHALGSFLYGKVPDSTNEEAVKCFQTAIEINPNRLMHYIELGQTYAQMGRTTDARRFIEKGLAMPDADKDDPEMKRHGRETLSNLH